MSYIKSEEYMKGFFAGKKEGLESGIKIGYRKAMDKVLEGHRKELEKLEEKR